VVLNIARGLDFLHDKGVAHGDLRTANVIVENSTAILVDYGLPPGVRIQENNGATAYSHFSAPETLKFRNIHQNDATREADMYALAAVFCEIIQARTPIDGLPTLWNLIYRCWSTDITERPSASEFLKQVRRASASITLGDRK